MKVFRFMTVICAHSIDSVKEFAAAIAVDRLSWAMNLLAWPALVLRKFGFLLRLKISQMIQVELS